MTLKRHSRTKTFHAVSGNCSHGNLRWIHPAEQYRSLYTAFPGSHEWHRKQCRAAPTAARHCTPPEFVKVNSDHMAEWYTPQCPSKPRYRGREAQNRATFAPAPCQQVVIAPLTVSGRSGSAYLWILGSFASSGWTSTRSVILTICRSAGKAVRTTQ